MIDVTTCRHRGGGQTLKLSVARDILLFAAREATYANGDDCVPPGFKPQVLDLNCPPATFEGDDDDRACLTCVSSGLAFGGGRPTVTARLGEVPLDGHEYVVVAGARSRSCHRSCCDDEGSRGAVPARLDYALVLSAAR